MPAAAGSPPSASTPAAQASFTSFYSPYASGGSTATRFPRRLAGELAPLLLPGGSRGPA